MQKNSLLPPIIANSLSLKSTYQKKHYSNEEVNQKKESTFMKMKKQGRLKISIIDNNDEAKEPIIIGSSIHNKAKLHLERDKTLSKIEEDKNEAMDSKLPPEMSDKKDMSNSPNQDVKRFDYYLEDINKFQSMCRHTHERILNGESKVEEIQVYSVKRKDRDKQIFDFLQHEDFKMSMCDPRPKNAFTPATIKDDKGKTPHEPNIQFFDNIKNSLSSRDALTPGFTSKIQSGVFKFDKESMNKKAMKDFDR